MTTKFITDTDGKFFAIAIRHDCFKSGMQPLTSCCFAEQSDAESEAARMLAEQAKSSKAGPNEFHSRPAVRIQHAQHSKSGFCYLTEPTIRDDFLARMSAAWCSNLPPDHPDSDPEIAHAETCTALPADGETPAFFAARIRHGMTADCAREFIKQFAVRIDGYTRRKGFAAESVQSISD